MSSIIDVISLTQDNRNFRKVLFTGAKSQLVAMRIPPGGEIGEEVHDNVEQTLFILSGSARTFLDGTETVIGPGSCVVVTPGTRHNLKTEGDVDLVLYTVYAPPNHIDGRVHATKVDADADHEDEAFGHGQH
jgi:mannose-6-phosphate isomerase-like protein (cupin superfamily)